VFQPHAAQPIERIQAAEASADDQRVIVGLGALHTDLGEYRTLATELAFAD
jgi:hypothetical protein